MRLVDRVARARRLLASVEKNFSPAVFASRFGLEDMVVLDLLARDGLGIPVVLLDTGCLSRETLALVARVRKQYGLDIPAYYPWPGALDALVEQYGIDGDEGHSAEAREASLAIREREPLRRALAGKRGWITAVRRTPADPRTDLAESGHDPIHRAWRFNPLVDWTLEDVHSYLDDNRVPYTAPRDPARPPHVAHALPEAA